MVDFNHVAIADVLKHPKLGLVSHQPSPREPIQDEIHVRDLTFTLHMVLASECDYPTVEERTLYWKTINPKMRY